MTTRDEEFKYRLLKVGEIIQAGDEVDVSIGGEPPKWVEASCLGTPVPSPFYTSHRIYRRLKGIPNTRGVEL